jgi:hypothetical protein
MTALVVAGACAALLAGCTDEPAPAPAPSPAAAAPQAEETPGLQTCQTLTVAIEDGSLMNPGVVDRIVRAGTTADAPVADAAQRLAAAYAAAVAARGLETEPDAVAAVSAAAADMSGVCDDSGLTASG